MQFLTETTELFGLLSDLSRFPKTAEFEDERVYAYTKLMEFLDRLKRHDSYVKVGPPTENCVSKGDELVAHNARAGVGVKKKKLKMFNEKKSGTD